MNAFKVVTMFENAVAKYTNSPYAVAVDSCTNAIFLSLKYLQHTNKLNTEFIQIPKYTYVSVPQSIMHAGLEVKFDDREWQGMYSLLPTPIYDSAKRFTKDMYLPGAYQCLSFHIKKHLKIGKGGMILTDDKEAVKFLKMARYEGRNEVDYNQDDVTYLGWNMYMTPEQAARGLYLLQVYPEHAEDLIELYTDLTTFTLFNQGKSHERP